MPWLPSQRNSIPSGALYQAKSPLTLSHQSGAAFVRLIHRPPTSFSFPSLYASWLSNYSFGPQHAPSFPTVASCVGWWCRSLTNTLLLKLCSLGGTSKAGFLSKKLTGLRWIFNISHGMTGKSFGTVSADFTFCSQYAYLDSGNVVDSNLDVKHEIRVYHAFLSISPCTDAGATS